MSGFIAGWVEQQSKVLMGEISKFLLKLQTVADSFKYGISESVGILEMERTVVPTSSLRAIPRPYRTEEKSSTRGWLGCSSELCHKSNRTFLNICCGWLAQRLAEFDQREIKPLYLCVCVFSKKAGTSSLLKILNCKIIKKEKGNIVTVTKECLFQGHNN